MSKTNISKFISLILRHKPEIINISLDKHGWANVEELITKINQQQKYHLTFADLENIVLTDNKQRYAFNSDKTLIRANQGHSIPVDVELEQTTPPAILFHGTSSRFEQSIDEIGLKKMSRNYVHLSSDIDTASIVGKRHGGKLVIYSIDTKTMLNDGYTFYKSINNVYLINDIPAKYLRKL